MSQRSIRIGTRGSELARAQTEITTALIRSADPDAVITTTVIQTEGDVNSAPIPLDTVGKGWFTKEIEQALIDEQIDLAVHSLKDLADIPPEGTIIAAYLGREDPRDVLVTKNGEQLNELPAGAVVGTDSERRKVQVLALRPDLVVKSIRGNVPTRLSKLETDGYDAVILAAAGLVRLGLTSRITQYFEVHEMTPAPGQGTLALQVRSSDDNLITFLEEIENTDAAHTAMVERSFSRAIGGGCKSPTGGYAFREGDTCVLIGMLLNAENKIFRDEMRAPWDESHTLGASLAEKMLGKKGAKEQ